MMLLGACWRGLIVDVLYREERFILVVYYLTNAVETHVQVEDCGFKARFSSGVSDELVCPLS